MRPEPAWKKGVPEFLKIRLLAIIWIFFFLKILLPWQKCKWPYRTISVLLFCLSLQPVLPFFIIVSWLLLHKFSSCLVFGKMSFTAAFFTQDSCPAFFQSSSKDILFSCNLCLDFIFFPLVGPVFFVSLF